MIPSSETRFLETIQKALGRSGPAPSPTDIFGPPPEDLHRRRKTSAGRTGEERMALLDTLTRRAAQIHCPVVSVADPAAAARTIRKWAEDIDPEWGKEKSVVAWDHPLVASLDLEHALGQAGIPLLKVPDHHGRAQREEFRTQVIQSYIGITSADYCVADTATLVMETRAGQPRSVSLVPSVHVAVITLDRILADLKELYLHLGWDDQGNRIAPGNALTFISGPSKTADIELTMVFGAHGPREVKIIVITG